MWILIEKHCVFIVPLHLDLIRSFGEHTKPQQSSDLEHMQFSSFTWIGGILFCWHFKSSGSPNFHFYSLISISKSHALNDFGREKNHPKKPTKKSGCEIGIAFGEIRTVIQNKCMCAFNRWANVCVISESPFFDAHKGVWIHFISSWVSNVNVLLFFLLFQLGGAFFLLLLFFFIIIIIAIERCKCRCCLIFLFIRSFVRFLSLMLHHIDMTSSE